MVIYIPKVVMDDDIQIYEKNVSFICGWDYISGQVKTRELEIKETNKVILLGGLNPNSSQRSKVYGKTAFCPTLMARNGGGGTTLIPMIIVKKKGVYDKAKDP